MSFSSNDIFFSLHSLYNSEYASLSVLLNKHWYTRLNPVYRTVIQPCFVRMRGCQVSVLFWNLFGIYSINLAGNVLFLYTLSNLHSTAI